MQAALFFSSEFLSSVRRRGAGGKRLEGPHQRGGGNDGRGARRSTHGDQQRRKTMSRLGRNNALGRSPAVISALITARGRLRAPLRVSGRKRGGGEGGGREKGNGK